jgi:hypothetical protein
MVQKIAYIDYNPDSGILEKIKETGFDAEYGTSLEEFCREHDLKDFFVMLCHPGLPQQRTLGEIEKKFPHLKIAIVTNAPFDYWGSKVPLFSYHSTEAIRNFMA